MEAMPEEECGACEAVWSSIGPWCSPRDHTYLPKTTQWINLATGKDEPPHNKTSARAGSAGPIAELWPRFPARKTLSEILGTEEGMLLMSCVQFGIEVFLVLLPLVADRFMPVCALAMYCQTLSYPFPQPLT